MSSSRDNPSTAIHQQQREHQIVQHQPANLGHSQQLAYRGLNSLPRQQPGIPQARFQKLVRVQEIEKIRVEGQIEDGLVTGRVQKTQAKKEEIEMKSEKFPHGMSSNQQNLAAITDHQHHEIGKNDPTYDTSASMNSNQMLQLTDGQEIQAPVHSCECFSNQGTQARVYASEKSESTVTENSMQFRMRKMEGKIEETELISSVSDMKELQESIQHNKMTQQNISSGDDRQIECYKENQSPVQVGSMDLDHIQSSQPISQEQTQKEQFSKLHSEKIGENELSITKTDQKTGNKYMQSIRFEEEEDGIITFVKEEWILRTYDIIIDTMIFEVEHSKEEGPPTYIPSRMEKFTDCCCQAYSCGNWRTFFNFRKRKSITRLLELSEPLRKARSLGIKGMASAVGDIYTKTPVGSLFRDIRIYAEASFKLAFFLVVLVGFILDRVNEDDREDDKLLLGNLCVSSIGIVFSAFGFLYHVCNRRCKTINEFKIWAQQKKAKDDPEANLPELEGKEQDPKQFPSNNPEPDSDECCQKSCNCCPKKCTATIDLVRIVISELMYYPELIMSIFQFSVQYIEEGENAKNIPVTTWLQEAISFLNSAFTIYIARTFILFGTVWSISKVRISNKAKWKGAFFHIYFVIYACFQMLLQVMMIFAIGVRFHHEYRETDNKADYSLSSSLWYMIILGYIIPILSSIMFFLVHHYWTQKFPMDVFKDMFLTLIKKPGKMETVMFWKKGGEFKDTMEKIMYYINREKFEKDYVEYASVKIENKILYPFTSPVHVIVCVLYTVLLLAFALSFIVNLPSYSTGWLIFTFTAMAVGTMINIYAMAVGILYIMILVGILVLVAVTIALCFLASCTTSTNDQYRR